MAIRGFPDTKFAGRGSGGGYAPRISRVGMASHTMGFGGGRGSRGIGNVAQGATGAAGLAAWLMSRNGGLDNVLSNMSMPDVSLPTILNNPAQEQKPNIVTTPVNPREINIHTTPAEQQKPPILSTPKVEQKQNILTTPIGKPEANIVFASGKDISGMAQNSLYRRSEKGRTVANQQQRKAHQRYGAGGAASDYVAMAKDMFLKNPTYDFSGSDSREFDMGHDLTSPYISGKEGAKAPTHYVNSWLNRTAEQLIRNKKVPVTALKDGQDYTPVIEYIINNPADIDVKPIMKQYPELFGSNIPDAAERLAAKHLIRLA